MYGHVQEYLSNVKTLNPDPTPQAFYFEFNGLGCREAAFEHFSRRFQVPKKSAFRYQKPFWSEHLGPQAQLFQYLSLRVLEDQGAVAQLLMWLHRAKIQIVQSFGGLYSAGVLGLGIAGLGFKVSFSLEFRERGVKSRASNFSSRPQ